MTQCQILLFTSHPNQPFVELFPTKKHDAWLLLENDVLCLARCCMKGHEHYDGYQPMNAEIEVNPLSIIEGEELIQSDATMIKNGDIESWFINEINKTADDVNEAAWSEL